MKVLRPLCKVTHCAGRVSANTRPHQVRWGDREMGTAQRRTACKLSKTGGGNGLGTRLCFHLLVPCPHCSVRRNKSGNETSKECGQRVCTSSLRTRKLAINDILPRGSYLAIADPGLRGESWKDLAHEASYLATCRSCRISSNETLSLTRMRYFE